METKTRQFCIHNKSSRHMTEVPDRSVDLILTSPPYNIGTRYGGYDDTLPHEEYDDLLRDIITECYRVLKPEGRFIIEVADTVFSKGKYIQLAGRVHSLARQAGFSLEQRLFNFAHTTDGVEQTEEGKWDDRFVALDDAHSNCNHILVLSPRPHSLHEIEPTTVSYFEYGPEEGHPCPIPGRHLNRLMDLYFTSGVVLDPFMGSGRAGAEAIRRGGTFIGYDINPEYCALAERRMSAL